jgi:hypothetical protein
VVIEGSLQSEVLGKVVDRGEGRHHSGGFGNLTVQLLELFALFRVSEEYFVALKRHFLISEKVYENATKDTNLSKFDNFPLYFIQILCLSVQRTQQIFFRV